MGHFFLLVCRVRINNSQKGEQRIYNLVSLASPSEADEGGVIRLLFSCSFSNFLRWILSSLLFSPSFLIN